MIHTFYKVNQATTAWSFRQKEVNLAYIKKFIFLDNVCHKLTNPM